MMSPHAPRPQPSRIVDLSFEIHTGMMVYPGDPEVEISQALTVGKDGVNVLRVHMGSQSGTHLDSPYHVDDSFAKLDELPLDRFLGRAVVVDARAYSRERSEIPWEAFRPVEAELGPGTIVLLRTDWSDRYFGTHKYLAHPYPSREAIERLVALGVRTIGLDVLSLDRTPDGGDDFSLVNHKVFAEPGGVIVENMTNLGAIDAPGALVSVLPLKLGPSDGAPIRAVAFWP
ncbi:cyclase family protein [Hyaloraphidium curvatum]|nr:cyclase family protein [Hyaloraphidium curvatum]